MARQIATAELSSDEAALHLYLGKRYELLSLPRWSLSSSPTPQPLGLLTEGDQIFFPAPYTGWVLANLTPTLPGPSGELGFMLGHSGGACVQWTRSVTQGGGIAPGRYYLETSLPLSPQYAAPLSLQAAVAHLMASLSSFVRRTYPLRSTDRYPTFIGPNLSREVQHQGVIVRYAGGSPMPLVANRSGAA